MRYALKYGDRSNDRRIPLYLPPGGEATLHALVGAFAKETGDDFLGEVFEIRTYDPGESLAVGDLAVRFAPTSHYITTFALRFESGAVSFVYSADTAPDEAVVALATGADAFLCESTLSVAGEADRPRGHSSAREAGSMAARAGVACLLLTHYPASANVVDLEASARAGFAGAVHVVDDGFEIALGGEVGVSTERR
jgi:ribonuclease BN (tRNA processing enzyme)